MAADVGHGNKGRGRIHTLCYIAAENALKPRQAWSSVQDSPFPLSTSPLIFAQLGFAGSGIKETKVGYFI